jgi:hypothetical protein
MHCMPLVIYRICRESSSLLACSTTVRTFYSCATSHWLQYATPARQWWRLKKTGASGPLLLCPPAGGSLFVDVDFSFSPNPTFWHPYTYAAKTLSSIWSIHMKLLSKISMRRPSASARTTESLFQLPCHDLSKPKSFLFSSYPTCDIFRSNVYIE